MNSLVGVHLLSFVELNFFVNLNALVEVQIGNLDLGVGRVHLKIHPLGERDDPEWCFLPICTSTYGRGV